MGRDGSLSAGTHVTFHTGMVASKCLPLITSWTSSRCLPQTSQSSRSVTSVPSPLPVPSNVSGSVHKQSDLLGQVTPERRLGGGDTMPATGHAIAPLMFEWPGIGLPTPPDITVPLVVVAVVFVALPGGDWLLNLVVDSYQRLFRPPHDPEGFTPAYLVMSSKLWLDVAIVMAILWLHDIAPTAIGLTPPSWWLTTLSVVGGGCLGWGMGFVYGQPTLTAAAVSGHQGGRRPRRVPRTGDRTHSWVPCLQGWAFYFVIAIAG